MKSLIAFVSFFVLIIFLLSCGGTKNSNLKTNKECRKFKKALDSLIIYDKESGLVYFNEKVTIKTSINDDGILTYRLPTYSIQAKLLSHCHCFVSNDVKDVKKALKMDQLPLKEEYGILQTIDHYNCIKEPTNCNEVTKLTERMASLVIRFETDDVIKEFDTLYRGVKISYIFK